MNCPHCKVKMNEAGYMSLAPIGQARLVMTHWDCPECGDRIRKDDPPTATGKVCAECGAPEAFNPGYGRKGSYLIDHADDCDAPVPCELIDAAAHRVAAAEHAAAEAGSPAPLLTALMGEVFRD